MAKKKTGSKRPSRLHFEEIPLDVVKDLKTDPSEKRTTRTPKAGPALVPPPADRRRTLGA